MKFNRITIVFVYIFAALSFCTAFRLGDAENPLQKPSFLPVFNQNQPGLFGIFSKPPEPEAEKKTDKDIIGHVGNVLHGGSFGFAFEARPLEAIHGIIGHAKKFLPDIRGVIGQPVYPPKPPPAEPPKSGGWESEKDEWEHQNPKKPKPEGPPREDMEENPNWQPEIPKETKPEAPNWDDIGEIPDHTLIPIEDIIQPRVQPRSRPKRFIESKIYHVPLLFRSNARPFQIRVKKENDIEAQNDGEDTKV